MTNVSVSKQHERNTDKAYELMGRLNRYDDCKTYTESLKREATKAYRVMPDGTIEFIR